MSQDNSEKEVLPERPRDTKTKIIEYTNFELLDKLYPIDVHQWNNSRFVTIHEGPYTSRLDCVAVPMSIMDKFIEKLKKVSEFTAGFDVKKAPQQDSSRVSAVHSISLISPGGRRYYFDLKVVNDDLVLSIAYLFNDRRSVVQIMALAVDHLVPLFEKLMKQHPSLTPSDDYSVNPNRRRFQGQQPQRRPFRTPYSSGYSGRGYRSGAKQTSSFNGKTVVPKDGAADGKRNPTLKVVNDPEPASIVNNAKKITCEIVEGSKTFFRITEEIKDIRKSTIHIPIEVCKELHCLMEKMNLRYTVVRRPSPEESVA